MSEMYKSINDLTQMASFYMDRTKVIQSNIANADTPGFKPKDLVFEKVLDNHLNLKREDKKHIDPFKKSSGLNIKEVKLSNYEGYDENRVDLQKELAKLAESSIMYKSMVEVMKKEFSKLQLAIKGK